MNLAPPGHRTTNGTTTGIRKAQENHHSKTSAFALIEKDCDSRRIGSTQGTNRRKCGPSTFRCGLNNGRCGPSASKRDTKNGR